VYNVFNEQMLCPVMVTVARLSWTRSDAGNQPRLKRNTSPGPPFMTNYDVTGLFYLSLFSSFISVGDKAIPQLKKQLLHMVEVLCRLRKQLRRCGPRAWWWLAPVD